MSELAHIGREFLTWLWFTTERDGDRVTIDGVDEARLLFANRLMMSGGGLIKENSTVVCDAPSQTDEARAALKTGKKVAKATLMLDLDERHYEVTVDASTFALTGVKLPDLLAELDEERLDERLSLLDTLEAALDSLYVRFATVRVDPEAWAETLAAMTRWAAAGPSNAAHSNAAPEA